MKDKERLLQWKTIMDIIFLREIKGMENYIHYSLAKQKEESADTGSWDNGINLFSNL